jgi:adenylyltransferase/sulfurtransferase
LELLPAEQRITPQQLQQLLARAAPAEADAAKAQQHQAEQQQLIGPPLLIDVRPAEQFAVMALPGAINMPFMQFDKHWPAALQLCGLDNQQQQQQQREASEQPQHQGQATTAAADSSAAALRGGRRVVVVMCRRGNHSQLAVQRLRQAGAAQVVDVVGGYEAWAQQVDSSMPQL